MLTSIASEDREMTHDRDAVLSIHYGWFIFLLLSQDKKKEKRNRFIFFKNSDGVRVATTPAEREVVSAGVLTDAVWHS